MLNKILIEMIIKQLLKDVFRTTLIKFYYDIRNNKTYYEITIFANVEKERKTTSKYIKLRVESWVELITDYKYRKDYLKEELIDSLEECSNVK